MRERLGKLWEVGGTVQVLYGVVMGGVIIVAWARQTPAAVRAVADGNLAAVPIVLLAAVFVIAVVVFLVTLPRGQREQRERFQAHSRKLEAQGPAVREVRLMPDVDPGEPQHPSAGDASGAPTLPASAPTSPPALHPLLDGREAAISGPGGTRLVMPEQLTARHAHQAKARRQRQQSRARAAGGGVSARSALGGAPVGDAARKSGAEQQVKPAGSAASPARRAKPVQRASRPDGDAQRAAINRALGRG